MRPLGATVAAADHDRDPTRDALVAGKRMPVGIPAFFIADALSRGRCTDEVLHGPRGLLAEYTGAAGYAYPWGQVIEIRKGRYVVWRFVPVPLWEALAPRRAASTLTIDELISLVQPAARRALRQLPPDVLLIGCQGVSRRSAHALFALLLADPDAEASVRQWLASVFLVDHLPDLLDEVERQLLQMLGSRTH